MARKSERTPPPIAAPVELAAREVAGGAGANEVADGWPTWASTAASIVLAIHIAAVAAGAFGVPPSSDLQRAVADLFTWHHGLFDQGYAYRYYSEPPPTPVVVATLHRPAGGPDVEAKIPEESVPGPPMRRQRQLALANALQSSLRGEGPPDARLEQGDPRETPTLARTYARQFCRMNPGCSSITIYVQQHLIPDPRRVAEALQQPGGRFDLDDESLFTTPRWIGDFPCDAF